MQDVKLYTYYRSSAAYRVRIALNIKVIAYQAEYIHLLKDGGQVNTAEYQQINPQKLLPSYREGDDIFTQSLAIIEYIDETHPSPPLLPSSALDRAFVRSLALSIACDIHPLDNLRVLKYLQNKLNIDKKDRDCWYCHWIQEGFTALETRLRQNNVNRKSESSDYCFGKQVTLADICLIPQVYNAIRFKCVLNNYPIINSIYNNCMKLPAFQQASPEQQVDFVEN